MDKAALLRNLPAVERVLNEDSVREAVESGMPRALVTAAVRDVLEFLRRNILEGDEVAPDMAAIALAVLDLSRQRHGSKIGRVVNATGIVLHTNLGRAPLAPQAVQAMVETAGYCNLEFDLETGGRGSRQAHIKGLIAELTGAEDAIVVNNNAAAVMLALTALTRGREVIVSRGQLVEIGGAFRVPEVLAQSGALMREVGTTNKTRIGDYHHAINHETGALLKVHTSNFKVMGFTEEVSLEELVQLGRRHNLWVIEDLGSGVLLNPPNAAYREPTVAESVATGADIVTFSGDKLLGGPQAGIIAGRAAAVETLARHPLMRALRPDKTTLAALEATLKLYRDPKRALNEIPALRMLSETEESLAGRAAQLAKKVQGALGAGFTVRTAPDYSEAGGGSLPVTKFPTVVVAVSSPRGGVSQADTSLRRNAPPVVARIKDDALLFDPRTIRDEEFDIVAKAVAAAFGV